MCINPGGLNVELTEHHVNDLLSAEVLVVDFDSHLREELRMELAQFGYVVHDVATSWQVMQTLEIYPIEAILIEVELPEVNGIELVRTLGSKYPTLLPILTAARPSVESATSAVRVGAFDYLIKPIDDVRLNQTVSESIHAKRILDEQSRSASDEDMTDMVSRLNQYIAADCRDDESNIDHQSSNPWVA